MRRPALIVAVLLTLLVAGVWVSVGAGSSHRQDPYGDGTYEVRAIFDNAAFAVPSETVRIAGAPVGSISSLSVTANYQAAVTMTISNAGFVPFHANATCAIRPQSLIAERYVDCDPGTAGAPPLTRIQHGPGAGSYLLPVTQTSSPVDVDIVQDIWQEPIRQRLSIILDELGTGLAARGTDLNAVIRRADPALGYTDEVFKILAQQNHVLAQLASDSDAVLAPLAGARAQIADFVTQADTTALAAAERSADIARSIQLLPSFLARLKPLMVDLGELADQGTPLMSSLDQSASALGHQFAELVPFASAARKALIELGDAAQESQGPLLASESLAARLNDLGSAAQPSAALLDRLTASLDKTGAIQQLMALLFYGTGASNGFDANGHYVRTNALVGSCIGYFQIPVDGCSANFYSSTSADVAARSAAATASSPSSAETSAPGTADASAAGKPPPALTTIVHQALALSASAQPSPLAGLLHYLTGRGQ
ncbi:MAG: MlaD family protein [Solirubrobacteraceae bacterium]|jgi:ABC-type transporter Mla subunit MlaD